jgi:hypothetical protein
MFNVTSPGTIVDTEVEVELNVGVFVGLKVG